MKKIFLIATLVISLVGFSQTARIVGDSTKLDQTGGGNNELIIENSTRALSGAYLKNVLNGRTVFQYVLDSVWQSGNFIRFRYGPSTVSINVNHDLVDSIGRRVGVDSFDIYKGGVYAYSLKDSVGGASINAINGLEIDGSDISLGGALGTPAPLLSNRHIDLNGNVLYITKGDFTPDLDAFDERYTPLYVHLVDTITSNDPAYSSTIPKSGGNFTREIRQASGAYKANNRYGWRQAIHYVVSDSMVIRTDGGDYGNALQAEVRYSIEEGLTGRKVVRIGNGTGADKRANEGVASIVANMFVEGTDATRYLYIRGHMTGVRPYLAMANGAPDTAENVVYYSGSSFVTTPSWVMNSYFIRPDVYWNRVDSAFFAFDTARNASSGKAIRAFWRAKTRIGANGTDWTSPYQFAVDGSTSLMDSIVHGQRIAVTDTTGMDIAVRDRSTGVIKYITADDLGVGGGGAAWGGITGMLSDQTDLQTALDGKVDATKTSGSNYAVISTQATGTPVIDLNTSNGTTEAILRVGNLTTGESEISFAADSLKIDFNNNEDIVDISDSADYYFLVKEKGSGAKKLAVAHWPAGGASTDTTFLSARIDRKYTLPLLTANNVTIGDAETRYFFNQNFAWHASSSAFAITVPKTGTLEGVNIELYCGSTVGTDESWSMYVRNNTTTTETLIAAVAAATANRTWTNMSMNIPVTAGDKMIIKSVTPTFATNPAGCYVSGYVIFN